MRYFKIAVVFKLTYRFSTFGIKIELAFLQTWQIDPKIHMEMGGVENRQQPSGK